MAKRSPENRAGTGQFKPGASGNPGGRPKDVHGIGDLARAHGPAALQKLVALMVHKDPRVSLAACQAVLDRGYGKPTQAIEHSGELKTNGEINHREVIRRWCFDAERIVRKYGLKSLGGPKSPGYDERVMSILCNPALNPEYADSMIEIRRTAHARKETPA